MTIKQFIIALVLGILLSSATIFGFVKATDYKVELSNESLETINYTKGIIANDYDLDGLNNSQEKKFGTDPYNSDTDNDGFSDAYEVNNSQLDPLQKDMRLEVDYEKGTEVKNFSTLTEEFENAPVENPDGTQGINLHIENDETDLELNNNYSSMRHRLNYSKHYDRENEGYYHVLIADNPTSFAGETNGYQIDRLNSVVVRDFHFNQVTLSRLMVFNMGINSTIYEGINTDKKECDEYLSVLNNNCLFTNPNYSDNSSFNDWDYINQSLAEYNPINNPSEPMIKIKETKDGMLY